MAALLQRVPASTGSGAGGKPASPRRVTGYLGLNPKAGKEAAALGKKSQTDVLVSLNDPVAEKKLKQADGSAVMDFVFDELGFDVADVRRWDAASDILLNADPSIREQLADMMRWFNSAERGKLILERLVLSGHSNGVELWGEAEATAESKPGTLVVERDLQALANVFPKAAGQVQDIMFSACFSLNAVLIVARVFPNLQTCWSYTGFSPSIKTGSARHIETWAGATEGVRAPSKREKRGSSALWTRKDGFIVGDPGAAAVGPLYARVVRDWRETIYPMYIGTVVVSKPRLDRVYPRIQALLAHPGADPSVKRKAEQARDSTLRLRFWASHVRTAFNTMYRAELAPAYQSLGLTQPDWSSITRPALKAHIRVLSDAIAAHPDSEPAKKAWRLVYLGLYGLDSEIIRSDWI